MSRKIIGFTVNALVGTGLFAAAVASVPAAEASPLKTGGYECIAQSAGAIDPVVLAPMCGPVADMAGVPLALPGPLPVGAAAVPVPLPVGAGIVPIPPVPAVVPPVPVGVPPVPVGVPPVPVGVPPIPAVVPPVVPPVGGLIPPVGALVPPVGAAAVGVPPVPVGLPAAIIPAAPAGLPILDMSGLGGKGTPTGPPPPGSPMPGEPIMPGPAG